MTEVAIIQNILANLKGDLSLLTRDQMLFKLEIVRSALERAAEDNDARLAKPAAEHSIVRETAQQEGLAIPGAPKD